MAHIKYFEDLKISIDAIKLATNNFADDTCIGKGGFGKVYVGEIVHSKRQMTVALKRLNRAFGQGDHEFWKEIMMLSLYKHKNIISLVGYSNECHESILVYPYMPNKSLDTHLANPELTWVQRLNICIGAARGLTYLHNATGNHRVFHRDIKSANILLDEDWNAKISDFGLSKFGPAIQQMSFLVSTPVGTNGYVDPLYAETGSLTKESDVYSFGMVLFEVLCGRLCFGNNNCRPLKGLVLECYKQNTFKDIIYEGIKDEIDGDSLKAFTKIAYRCLEREREKRPLMIEIVKALEISLEHQISEKAHVGILNVKVLRAMNLKETNHIQDTWSGHYAEVRLTDLQVMTTTAKYRTSNPKWFEEFDLDVKDPFVEALQILVYLHKWMDPIQIGKDHMLGMNVMPLKYLTPEVPKVVTLDLLDEEEPQGQIVIEVTYKPFTEAYISKSEIPYGGILSVTILGWENFEAEKHDNPYVRLHFQGEKNEFKVDDTNQGQKEFRYKLEKTPVNERLYLEVVTKPRMRLIFPEECLGYVAIEGADVVKNEQIEQIYHLLDSKNNKRLHLIMEWESDEMIFNNKQLRVAYLVSRAAKSLLQGFEDTRMQ